jgi:hypothetical protein
MLVASPQQSEALANTTTETRKKRRRPYRSLNLPASDSAKTIPTEYAVIVQLVQLIEVCSPFWIACSAVATMVPSKELISKAIATTAKIANRRGASISTIGAPELRSGAGTVA